jgi:hypothetical protein
VALHVDHPTLETPKTTPLPGTQPSTFPYLCSAVHDFCIESTGSKVWVAITLILGAGVTFGGAAIGGWANDCKRALSGLEIPSASFFGGPPGFSRSGCQVLVDASAGGVVNLTWIIAAIACVLAAAIIYLTNRAPKKAPPSA